MTQKRLLSTKALSAFLVSRHKSLSAAVQMIGGEQEAIAGDTVSDDLVGRIARLLNLAPEELASLTERHAAAAIAALR